MFKRTGFILFFSMLFFILVLANYFINLYILRNAINDLQVNAINNASKQIIKWTEEKIKAVKIVENLISNINHTEERYYVRNVLENSSSVADFSYMFVGYDDNTIISSKSWIKPLSHSTISMPWYKETLENNQITITDPYISTILDSLVVAICYPTKDIGKTNGVVCGILPLEYIQNELLKISLPYDGNVFLMDKNKKILVHKEKEKLFKTFDQRLDKEGKLTVTKDNIYSQGFIKYGNWYLISQLDKRKVYERVDFQLKINLIIYGFSLIVFLWLNLFYNRNQKRSEEKLKISQTLVRSFMQSDHRGFLTADVNHNVTYYNDKFAKLLGLYDSNLDNINLSKCANSFDNPPPWINDCLVKQLKATKEKQETYTNTFDFYLNSKKVFLMFTSIPLNDNNKKYQGLIFAVDDITNKELEKKLKKEQEDVLFQQGKMADLGEMIGAISHQWRQPLNSLSLLLGNLLQFKEMGCLSDDVFKDNLNHALTNTNYLSNTIDTFRNFYLPNRKIEKFDIIEAIKHTNIILEPYFKNSGINIEVVHKSLDYICFSYKNELQQIIASLVLNARDALLEEKNSKQKSIKIIIENKKDEYHIKVEDNGTGVKLSIKETLFEPFKTTKGEKGTGSGLYLSRLIARSKLLGDLTIISYKDPTTFLFNFPKEIKEKND